jgi:hypothetical protein
LIVIAAAAVTGRDESTLSVLTAVSEVSRCKRVEFRPEATVQ